MKNLKRRTSLHIVLTLRSLSNQKLIEFGENIGKMAPTSPICTQNPPLSQSCTTLAPTISGLKDVEGQIVKAEADLALLRQTRDMRRLDAEKGVTLIRQLVEHHATTPEEAASLGFIARVGGAPQPALQAPSTVAVKLGKKHGSFRVSAVSPLRGKWDLEISTDTANPTNWTRIDGNGRSRSITGRASGTVVWVRMRLVRGQVTSDWCAPVPVTVP